MGTNRRLACAASAVVLTFVCAGSALAQPGAPPPPPPGGGGYYGGGYYGGGYYPAPQPIGRQGWTIGFGLGVGSMEDDSGPIQCFDCNYDPVAGSFDFHIGGMLNPRMALLFEIWGQGQTLEASGATALMQTMVMGALQYWVTPIIWLKGGLGVANLTLSHDDRYQDDETIDNGGAIMGAVGVELVHSRTFGLDLQLRIGAGTYDGIQEQISTGVIAVGFNWY